MAVPDPEAVQALTNTFEAHAQQTEGEKVEGQVLQDHIILQDLTLKALVEGGWPLHLERELAVTIMLELSAIPRLPDVPKKSVRSCDRTLLVLP